MARLDVPEGPGGDAAMIWTLRPEMAGMVPASFGLERLAFEARELDLGNLLRDAAHDLEPLARSHAVRISLAVSPGRREWADPFALGSALREVMTAAIHAAVGGQVLVSALPLGTQLHIVVTDDGPDTTQAVRESIVRESGATMALIGGSISVEVRAGRGTTVTLRLPHSPATVDDPTDEAALPVLAA